MGKAKNLALLKEEKNWLNGGRWERELSLLSG